MNPDPTTPLAIDTEAVMHETIDGEVVIIHLDQGTYYSLTGAGALLWNLLEQGRSALQLAAAAGPHYDAVPEDRLREDAQRFLGELHREGLVRESEGAAEGETTMPFAPTGAYETPTLTKYTDMEELLLVDPIHEVEDSGWPNVE